MFDLYATTPNVEISRDSRDIVIRGVSKDGLGQTQDVLTQSQSDVVTTYLDGAPVSSWAGATSTWDLQQVEVLRGVQTNTFGRGAMAGAVILKSNDPTYQYEARVRGGYADPETFDGAAMVNIPLAPDQAALRLSVERSDAEGTIDNLTRGDFEDPDEHLTVRAKALIEPTDDFSALFSLTVSDRERGSGFVDLARFPRERVSFTDQPGTFENLLAAGSALLRLDAGGGLTLESETTITSEDARRVVDGDATALPIITADVDEDLSIFGQELRARYAPADAAMSGFLGVNLRRFHRETRNRIPTFGLDIAQDLALTSLGLFGEVRYRVAAPVEVYFGGRFDVEELDFEAAGASSSETFTSFSPKVGVAVELAEDIRLIGEIEQGRRAGGAGVSLLSGTPFVFDEESAWNYELTLRTSWFDNRLSLDATGFYFDWKDQQVEAFTAFNNPFDTIIVNAGESTQYGAEVEAGFQATEAIRLTAGLGLLNTEFDRFVTAGNDLSGNQFPNAPSVSADFGVTWAPLSGALRGLVASAGVSWRGAYFSDVQNTAADEVDARTLVNLSLAYQAENFRVGVFARNLLDEEYLTVSTSSLGTGAAGAPRTVGAFGEIRF